MGRRCSGVGRRCRMRRCSGMWGDVEGMGRRCSWDGCGDGEEM